MEEEKSKDSAKLDLRPILQKSCFDKNWVLQLKQSKEEETQIIIHHWIRTLNIKLGWINEFNKLVVNYVSSFVLSFFKISIKIFKYT
ncbi:hypothetical protein RFI_25165 [Reticulomyxa filosa]|uniref:Uncharacterized protein n=1 Tax=Reticulomyxa filosa TaxID=46433 RepID=X6MGN2_RETFI|nr:hypothetical protein RFI_25165 [Reticulomyxa filosa]|eukprot:ETO12210.1 hypothetical protein RFI_25165 [Reticulomyxa filosa]